MAKKIYKESVLTTLPATSDMKYLPGYKVKVKSGNRFKSYILSPEREWIFDQGITDSEQAKLTGLKDQAGIDAQINQAINQANGVPIPLTNGTVLPQGTNVPASITISGQADLIGNSGGTTYTQTGGAPISVAEGKFRKGYYTRSTNLWTASIEYDLPDKEFTIWSPKSFKAKDQASHIGTLWEATADTLSTDVPSISNKWKPIDWRLTVRDLATSTIAGDLTTNPTEEKGNLYLAKKSSPTVLSTVDITSFTKVRMSQRNNLNIEGYYGK